MGKVYSGPRNPNWRGGRTVTQHGYVLIRVGTDHHLADVRGYAYEHRLVAEEKLGRRLRLGEEVHHLNEDKQDNRPENLEVVPDKAHHGVRHRSGGKATRMPREPNPEVSCACGCGERFSLYDQWGRPRRFISGHNTNQRSSECPSIAA